MMTNLGKLFCDVMDAGDNEDLKAMTDILYQFGLQRLHDSVRHIGEEYNKPLIVVSPAGVYDAPTEAYLQYKVEENRLSGLPFASFIVTNNVFICKTGDVAPHDAIIMSAGIGDRDTNYHIIQGLIVCGKSLVLGKITAGFQKLSEVLAMLEDRPEVMLGIAASFDNQTEDGLRDRIGDMSRRIEPDENVRGDEGSREI